MSHSQMRHRREEESVRESWSSTQSGGSGWREDKERGEATGKGEQKAKCSQRPGEEEQEKATGLRGLRSDHDYRGGVGWSEGKSSIKKSQKESL
mgnify:CR=1 FL=1